jgi:hypothetical protein
MRICILERVGLKIAVFPNEVSHAARRVAREWLEWNSIDHTCNRLYCH